MTSREPPGRRARELSWTDVRDGVALVGFPELGEEDANRICVALGERLRSSGSRPRGLLDAIPAARSLLIVFDPARVSHRRLRSEVAASAVRDVGREASSRLLRIPVAYGGPDLPELAGAAGMTAEEFARRHAGAEYRVAFNGFAPGFAYLAGLPVELRAPRRPSPRVRVPAGSVAIGGSFTGIYPAASPGGWRLIGSTTVRLFDPESESPALLNPGDRVRFEAVPRAELPEPAPAPRPRPAGRPVFRAGRPGLATTIQGGPAYGLGSSGVPAGGAMDAEALARANALAGNSPGTPALEMALFGPELEVLSRCSVALAGADFGGEWNGRAVAAGDAWTMDAGDRLRLPRARSGARTYLAVSGGLEAALRHAPAPRLAAGEIVTAAGSAASDSRPLDPAPAEAGGEIRLRVMLGPEAEELAPGELERFLATPWRVSEESDRRGLRLEGLQGPPFSHRAAAEIPPSGTVAGSIQLPGNGLPIVLGPDGPVTGGYPRIATVIGADLCRLGRAGPGTVLRLAAVSLEESLEARSAARRASVVR